MRVHPNKRGIRAMGIAESFRKTDRRSTIAGVVMRSDLVLDGFVFGEATVGGDDATRALVRMHTRLHRDDVNVILLSGAIISYYNVVDVQALADRTGVPVICITYRESSGVEGAIRDRFEDWQTKVGLYRRLGGRTRLSLKTGQKVFARLASVSEDDARQVVDAFTLQGSFSEPIRVARLLARAKRGDQARA
jgi:endonuclease V-like protein UPF0215 family